MGHLYCAIKIAKSSNKRAASSRVSQNKSPRESGNQNPPMLDVSIHASHRFRFVNNGSAFTGAISFEDLQDLMCVATGATAAFRLWDAVKLKEVEVWGANSAGNASNTVQVEYLDSLLLGGPGKTFSDTALGLQNIAHVRCKPPKGSRASFWLNNTTGAPGNDYNLFNLNVPLGGVVDISLEFVFYDNDNPVAVTGTVTGATVGKTYCRALDSAQNTAILLPVGYDTI